MQKAMNRKAARRRIRFRVRRKVSGTAHRPRLAIYRSLKHIYAQAIDDQTGKTVAQASTVAAALRSKSGGNVDAAKQVGEAIGAQLKEAGIETVVFDRGGFVYHGRVKALADAVRSAGVKL